MRITSLFLVFTIFLVGGCDGPSSFERTNPEDPESEQFVPRPAEELIATPKQNGTVRLRWVGASKLTDGHLIEKSTGDKDSFEPLATVSGSDSTFRDTTHEFERPTYYRVRPFTEKGEGRSFSEEKKTRLQLGSIKSFQVDTDPDGTLRLSWVDSLGLERAFRIEVSVDGSPFREVATRARNSESFTDRPNLSFADTSRRYRITAPLLGSENAQADTVTRSVAVREAFGPKNLTADIIDEETTHLTWQPRAYFADHVQVVARGENPTSVSVNATASEYTLDHVLRGHDYRLIVYAVDEDGNRSNPASTGITVTISPPVLSVPSSNNAEVVTLSWTPQGQVSPAGFVLVRHTLETGSQKEIKLPADLRSYEDAEVDTDNEYRYQIRTKATQLSESRRVGYFQDYQRVWTISEPCGAPLDPVSFYPSSRGIDVHPSGSPIAAVADTNIALIDSETGTVTDCLSEGEGNEYDFYMSVSFSPNGRLLGAGRRWSTASLWSVDSYSLLHHFEDVGTHTTAFGPEGNRFASADPQGTLNVWSTEDGSMIWSKEVEYASSTRQYISFSSLDEVVATGRGSRDWKAIKLRNSNSGRIEEEFSSVDYPDALRFARISKSTEVLVASGRSGVRTSLLDPEDGTQIRSIPGRIATVSRDSDRIAVLNVGAVPDFGERTYAHSIWSFPELDAIGLIDEGYEAKALALPPGGDGLVMWTEDGVIRWKSTSTSRWQGIPQ